MGGDQAEEMAGKLVDFARRLASTAEQKEVTDEVLFEKELVELYSSYLRSKGFMIVKRERLIVLDYNHQYDPRVDALNKVPTIKLLESLDARTATEIGRMALRQGLFTVFDEPTGDQGEYRRRRYELVVLQPKVVT